MSTNALPALGSAAVLQPDHARELAATPSRHRIHISRLSGQDGPGWHWTHLLRAVGGWCVLAAGVLSAQEYLTAEDAAAEVERRWQGESGDGFDRLPRERSVQQGTSTTAHLLRGEVPGTYCGAIGNRPAVFDTRVKGHAEQHCIDCTQGYQAEHYGRNPVTR
jgi:hypothetical protein